MPPPPPVLPLQAFQYGQLDPILTQSQILTLLPNLYNNTQRTGVGASGYTILATDRYIGLTLPLAGPVTWPLPKASTFPAGTALIIADEVGGISVAHSLTIAAFGGDTIDGLASIAMTAAYQVIILYSDGTSRWTYTAAGSVGGGGLADPGLNGIIKRTALNVTAPATLADFGTGTPSAGQYVDGGTGAWTNLNTTTIVRLAQVITAGSQATVDFSSIPAGFSALKILWLAQDTQAGTASVVIRVRLNGDSTAANYTSAQRSGGQNGGSFGSVITATTGGVYIGSQPQAGNTSIANEGEITLVAYSNSTWHKRFLCHCGQDDGTLAGLVVTSTGRWKSTAPINQATFTTDGTAFTNGSIFTLYGMP